MCRKDGATVSGVAVPSASSGSDQHIDDEVLRRAVIRIGVSGEMEVGALDVAFGAADAKHLAVRLEQRGLPGRVGFYDCGHRRAQGHFERVGLEAAEAREADAFETQRTGFR